MKLKAIGSSVLLRLKPAPEKPEGSIVIVENERGSIRESALASVASVGPRCTAPLQVGDEVVVHTAHLTQAKAIPTAEGPVYIVNESNILGVVDHG
mgnify:CR=1 FL=1